MAETDRIHWDARYRANAGLPPPTARPWLVDHATLIDPLADRLGRAGRTPQALDLACGSGRNLLWLAHRGWQVTGVDISGEALALARRFATAAGAADRIHILQADLDQWQPPPDAFDLVICFFFLDRRLWSVLHQALRPGGLFFMQTYNQHRRDFPAAYLLQPGELVEQVAAWDWQLLDAQCEGPELERPTDAVVARRVV